MYNLPDEVSGNMIIGNGNQMQPCHELLVHVMRHRKHPAENA